MQGSFTIIHLRLSICCLPSILPATKSTLLNTHCTQCNPANFILRGREEVTAGWECSSCWTHPDISHRVEVCWMWERTLPFNQRVLSPSHPLMFVQGKRCMGLTSRQPEGPLRSALPPPAHSTHMGSRTAITRRTEQHSQHKERTLRPWAA